MAKITDSSKRDIKWEDGNKTTPDAVEIEIVWIRLGADIEKVSIWLIGNDKSSTRLGYWENPTSNSGYANYAAVAARISELVGNTNWVAHNSS